MALSSEVTEQNVDEDIVTQAELARMYNVTATVIRGWIQKGMPLHRRGTTGGGRNAKSTLIRVSDCVRWREKYLKEEKSEAKVEFDEAKRRKMLAEAEKTELEVQVRKGELVEVDEIGKAVESDYMNLRAKLLAIPSSLAPILEVATTAIEIKNCLEDAINEALSELSMAPDLDNPPKRKRSVGRAKKPTGSAKKGARASKAAAKTDSE